MNGTPDAHEIELRHLRVVEAIHRLGSLTAAADEQGVTPSQISKTLKQLEDRVGRPLLIRSRTGVRLTPAGEALLKNAQGVLQSVARMLDEAVAGGEPGPRVIAVGIHPLAAFLGTHEDLQLLHEHQGQFVVQPRLLYSPRDAAMDLEAGILDLAYTVAPLPPPLRSVLRGESGWSLAVASNHPLARRPYATPADLSQLTLAVSEDPFSARMVASLSEQMAGHGFQLKTSHPYLEEFLRLAMVAGNGVVSILPTCYQSLGPPGIVYVPLSDLTLPPSQIYLSFDPGTHRPWVQQAIRELLSEVLL